MQSLVEKSALDSSDFFATQQTCSVKLILVPIGTTAIDVHFPDSEIDCLVVGGNISPSTFWEIAEQSLFRIMDDAENAHDLVPVVLNRFVKSGVVQMMTFRIDGFILRLQYCLATVLAENWSRLINSMDYDNVLPDPSMKLLNACRDRRHLRNSVPSFSSFQLAYRLVKLFCIRRGLYAPHLGFLGDVHLETMMRLVAERLPESFSAFELIKEFFRTYSSFDWASQTVSVTDSRMAYRRSAQEPMVILSPQSPAINAAANISFSTWQTIIKELCLGCKLLAEGAPLAQIWTSEASSLAAFLIDYSSFVKVDVGYWGASCTSARALIGYMESCLSRLLVDLDSADQNTIIRLWPDRLTDSSYMATDSVTSFMRGFYLLGLQPQRNDESMRQLIGVLGAFEDSVRKNTLYFDASTSFFTVAMCTREDLLTYGNIEVDRPVWRDDGIDEALKAADNRDRQENFVKQSASKKQRKRANRNVSKVEGQGPVVRLRTSSDVYNRLLWDRRYNEADYLIGYEDRFMGTKEIPLKSWSKQIEDENFIPFHRIVHFRCKSTGELLWDRGTKLDRVFGSSVLTSER
ncbi:hypothetical protein ACEPAG_5984 [Sanghuangporus baumii]